MSTDDPVPTDCEAPTVQCVEDERTDCYGQATLLATKKRALAQGSTSRWQNVWQVFLGPPIASKLLLHISGATTDHVETSKSAPA